MKIDRINLLILGLFVSLGTSTLVIIWSTPEIWTHEMEGLRTDFVKYLLQLIIVVGLGGIIKILFDRKEKNRQEARAIIERKQEFKARIHSEAERQNDLRVSLYRDYLRQISEHFRDVKASRRALRAAGLSTKYGQPKQFTNIQTDIYIKEMKRLDTLQLEIEGIKIESSLLPDLMGIKRLKDDLQSMETYLRDVLSEYEKLAIKIEAGIRFSLFERLSEFTSPTRSSGRGKRFLTHFWEPYQQIVSKLGHSIVTNSNYDGPSLD